MASTSFHDNPSYILSRRLQSSMPRSGVRRVVFAKKSRITIASGSTRSGSGVRHTWRLIHLQPSQQEAGLHAGLRGEGRCLHLTAEPDERLIRRTLGQREYMSVVTCCQGPSNYPLQSAPSAPSAGAEWAGSALLARVG